MPQAIAAPKQGTVETSQAFEAITETSMSTRNGLTRGGVSDRTRDRLVREEDVRIARTRSGEPWAVYSVAPLTHTISLGELGSFHIPAPDVSVGYGKLVIRHRVMSMRDGGDAIFTPVAVSPMEIAQELQRELEPFGGAIICPATQEPTAEEMKALIDGQLGKLRRMFENAQSSWTRYKQYKMITDLERHAARTLHARGMISELPPWVEATREDAAWKPCPACSEEVRTAAAKCRHCGFVIDAKRLAQAEQEARGEAEDAGKPARRGARAGE